MAARVRVDRTGRELTHVLQQLHFRGQALQRLVVLALEVIREALAGGVALRARRARAPRGRGRETVVLAKERRTVAQALLVVYSEALRGVM